jgi:hypothetical protein
VTIAEFGFAAGEQADERSVDVAEAEEAEVVSSDGNLLDRILGTTGEGKVPSRQPARPFDFAQGRLPALLSAGAASGRRSQPRPYNYG